MLWNPDLRIRYAALALVELAAHTRATPLRSRTIATKHKIPLRFLDQLLFRLRNSKLVAASRGPAGGFWIGRPPDTITLAEIAAAVQPQTSTKRELKVDVLTQHYFLEAENRLHQYLASITVATMRKRALEKGVISNVEIDFVI